MQRGSRGVRNSAGAEPAPCGSSRQPQQPHMIAETPVTESADKTLGELSNRPLLIACARGDCNAVQRMLLDESTDVDERCEFGLGPLHHALRAASADAVALCSALVQRGADANASDGAQFTPLMSNAIWTPSEDAALTVAALLIDHGADTERAMCEGRRAVEYAQLYQMPRLAAFLASPSATNQHSRMRQRVRRSALALAKARLVCDARDRGDLFGRLTRWLDVELVAALAGAALDECECARIVDAIRRRCFFSSLAHMASCVLGPQYHSLANTMQKN